MQFRRYRSKFEFKLFQLYFFTTSMHQNVFTTSGNSFISLKTRLCVQIDSILKLTFCRLLICLTVVGCLHTLMHILSPKVNCLLKSEVGTVSQIIWQTFIWSSSDRSYPFDICLYDRVRETEIPLSNIAPKLLIINSSQSSSQFVIKRFTKTWVLI